MNELLLTLFGIVLILGIWGFGYWPIPMALHELLKRWLGRRALLGAVALFFLTCPVGAWLLISLLGPGSGRFDDVHIPSLAIGLIFTLLAICTAVILWLRMVSGPEKDSEEEESA